MNQRKPGNQLISDKRRRKESYLLGFDYNIFALFLIFAVLSLATSCYLAPLRTVPLSEVRSIKAESSFFYRGETGQGRSRLVYYLQLPDRIRLEIFNPFGGLEYILWLNGQWATLFLPGQRVFWEGDSCRPLAEFIGGEIEARELAGLLSGRVVELGKEPGWKLNQPDKENFYRGEKAGWKFEIKEFFKGGEIPRTIYFEKPGQLVRLRVLKIRINQDFKQDIFVPLTGSAKKLTWEEISALWKR